MLGEGEIRKRPIFLSFWIRLVVFGWVMVIYGLSSSFVLAGAVTGISYGGSGDVVGTYIQASQSDFLVFSPATAVAAASTIEVTFPTGTTLTNANLAASDFLMVQGTQGLCTTAGTQTAPTMIVVNEGNRTITFTLALGSISKTAGLLPCGLGEMTVKTSATLGGNEIRHPTATTATGTLSVVIGAAVDSGSISNVTFVADTATQLAFTTQPANIGTAGQNLGTQPVVTVQDQYGNIVTSSSVAITLSAVLSSDTNTAGGGTLNAVTNPLSASAGVATFAGVNYTKAEAIKLKALSSGLTTAFSDTVTISAGTASKIGVSQQPSSTVVAGTNLSTQPIFLIQDEFENTVSLDNSTQVTLASVLSSDGTTAGGGTLNATSNPVTASSGIITFVGVNYTKAETIKLKATASGLSQVLTDMIVVSAGTAAEVVKIAGDLQFLSKSQQSSLLIVTLEDQFNNPVSGGTVNFSITEVPSGAIGQNLSVISVITDSEGQASSRFTAGSVLGTYKVTVTGSGSTFFSIKVEDKKVSLAHKYGLTTDPVCLDIPPGLVPPWIYAAKPVSSTSMLIYFAEAGGVFERYSIEYGTESEKYIYAADGIALRGDRTYVIRLLAPNTKYFVRIRAGNGCATGPWSPEFEMRTMNVRLPYQLNEDKILKIDSEVSEFKLMESDRERYRLAENEAETETKVESKKPGLWTVLWEWISGLF